jgi:hypothetical protein
MQEFTYWVVEETPTLLRVAQHGTSSRSTMAILHLLKFQINDCGPKLKQRLLACNSSRIPACGTSYSDVSNIDTDVWAFL